MLFKALLLSTLPLVAVAQSQIASGQQNSTIDGIPVILPVNRAIPILKDRYIVVFKEEASAAAIDSHKDAISSFSSSRRKRGLSNTQGINKNFGVRKFRGYSGHFDKQTLRKISQSKVVDYIEAITYKTTQTVQTYKVYYNLNRVSHRNITSPYSYLYPSSSGSGVTVYVLDTGIYVQHPDFGGRASWGPNFSGDNYDTTDGVGHGTHCAGVVGGTQWGIAKNANLVAVKVLNATGFGDSSTVMAGINWVVKNRDTSKTSIITMSLGGPASTALNQAVNNAVAAGVFITVAAGNDNVDASNSSPASAASALAVGAVDDADNKASFSNYGKVVRIWAPGVNVPSDYNNGGAVLLSGTSMATPHIAGIAALMISQAGGVLSPQAIINNLISQGSANVNGGPSPIAYNGGENGFVMSSSSSTTSATQTSTTRSSSTTTISSIATTASSTVPVSTLAPSTSRTSTLSTSTIPRTSAPPSTTSARSSSTTSSVRSSTTTSSTKSTPTPAKPQNLPRCNNRNYWLYFNNPPGCRL